jgi:hypothetical protein
LLFAVLFTLDLVLFKVLPLLFTEVFVVFLAVLDLEPESLGLELDLLDFDLDLVDLELDLSDFTPLFIGNSPELSDRISGSASLKSAGNSASEFAIFDSLSSLRQGLGLLILNSDDFVEVSSV